MKMLVEKLEDRFVKWEKLHDDGCSDPIWSDGVNMRLVRNHIINTKRQIEELCTKEGQDLPEIYHKETPPEVDRLYMARKDEIKETAIIALEAYEKDQNFSLLEELYPRIQDKRKKEIAGNILGYKLSLKQAIKENNYITMRRHRNPEWYTMAPKEFLANIEGKDFEGQISIWVTSND